MWYKTPIFSLLLICAFQCFQVREWELQFSEKYDFIGKLIKPGEEPTFYSDASSEDEEEDEKKAAEDKKAQWKSIELPRTTSGS